MASTSKTVLVHPTNVTNKWMHCVCTVGFDLTDGHAIQETCGQPLTEKEQMQMFSSTYFYEFMYSLLFYSVFLFIALPCPFQMALFHLHVKIYTIFG